MEPLTFPGLSYRYRYPVSVFGEQEVLPGAAAIRRRLRGRNVYYRMYTERGRSSLVARAASFDLIREFILETVRRIVPGSIIVSLYLYGSYLYGESGYVPDDIDFGVVIRGGMSKYVLRDVSIPPPLSARMTPAITSVNIFFYGEDNMTRGSVIDDTVHAEMTHRETTKRELSVGYWRNIVLLGKDFRVIAGNEYNLLVTMLRLLEHTYQRLSHGSASDPEFQRKIATRLYEANVFLDVFKVRPVQAINRLHHLIVMAQRGALNHGEATAVFAATYDRYTMILSTYL